MNTALNKKQRLDIEKRLEAAEMAMCVCVYFCIVKTHNQTARDDAFTLSGKKILFYHDCQVESMSSSATFIDALCVINHDVNERCR